MGPLHFLRLVGILLTLISEVGALPNDCELLGNIDGYSLSKICAGGTSLGRSVLVDMYDTNDLGLSTCGCKVLVHSPSGTTSLSISNFKDLGPNSGCESYVEVQRANGEKITGQCHYVAESMTVEDGDVITMTLFRQPQSDSRYCVSLTLENILSTANVTCSNDIQTTSTLTTTASTSTTTSTPVTASSTPIPTTTQNNTSKTTYLQPTTNQPSSQQPTTSQLTTPQPNTKQPTTTLTTTKQPTTTLTTTTTLQTTAKEPTQSSTSQDIIMASSSSTKLISPPVTTSGTTIRGDATNKMNTSQGNLDIIIPTVVGGFFLLVVILVIRVFCRREKQTYRGMQTYSNPDYSQFTSLKSHFDRSVHNRSDEDMKEIVLHDYSAFPSSPPPCDMYPAGTTPVHPIAYKNNTYDNPLFDDTTDSETSLSEGSASAVVVASGNSSTIEVGVSNAGLETPSYAVVNKASGGNNITFIQI
ncbi:endochitinase A-like [Mizuhopecten yessoensis]|uniref:Uncharacterized protein n=1 Tax=Mizuhopecten yessoensis TaxID=6573 RepID=A0A210R1P2_MIZYE|nr:endochitinase A-like [Mizuhopecten yessoensis]OWF54801.1 hypothetical protein KP79_PYT06590 [Mizuhopecten yessoensis]